MAKRKRTARELYREAHRTRRILDYDQEIRWGDYPESTTRMPYWKQVAENDYPDGFWQDHYEWSNILRRNYFIQLKNLYEGFADRKQSSQLQEQYALRKFRLMLLMQSNGLVLNAHMKQKPDPTT